MSVSRADLLRWQFDLTWSLLGLHLEQLKPDDFLWEPAAHCWTVRPGVDGVWVPDWQEPEPEPAPIPTIGWVSWYIGWWWTVTLDHAQGRPPRDRSEIGWPGEGTATIEWLRGLRTDEETPPKSASSGCCLRRPRRASHADRRCPSGSCHSGISRNRRCAGRW